MGCGDPVGLAVVCRWGEGDGPGPIRKLVRFFDVDLRLSCAQQPECLVEPIDKIDDVIPSPFGVGRDLPGEIRALNRDRRNEPCRQSAQCKKRNCEKQRNCLGASKCPARHFRHQRIEQIGKNCSDRHRDQNRLEKTDDAGAGPNHGANDDDENHDETGSQRRPHHLALPQCGVFLHLSTSSKCRPRMFSVDIRCSMLAHSLGGISLLL